MEHSQRPVLQKLHELMKSCRRIKKTGHNAHFKYRFVEENELLKKVGDKMVALGLELIPSCRTCFRDGTVTTVIMDFKIIDKDSNDSETGSMPGQGADSQDKGAAKAVVSATKYFFLKLLMMSTGEDDPEYDRFSKEDVAEDVAKAALKKKVVAPSGETVYDPNADIQMPKTLDANSKIGATHKKQLASACKENKKTSAELKAFLKARHSLDSVDDLTLGNFDAVMKWATTGVIG